MKKLLSLLLCFAVLLTFTGCGGESGGKDTFTLPNDAKTLLAEAGERTAAFNQAAFTAQVFGTDYTYSNGKKYFTFMYQFDTVINKLPDRMMVGGTYEYQRSIAATRSANCYYFDTTELSDYSGYQCVPLIYLLPLKVTSKDFLDRHLPDNAAIQTEGDLYFVEFTVHIGDLSEALIGELPADADSGNLAQLRLYVNQKGQLIRMEMDHPGLPDNEGDVYTTWISYDALGEDAGIAARPDGSNTTEEAQFPEAANREIHADNMKKTDYTLTTETAVDHIGKLSMGYYSTVALKDDGTVIYSGDEDKDHSEVLNWTNIKYVHAGSYGIYGIQADGTLLRSGKDTQTTQAWDLSGFTDLVSVFEAYQTLFALKADGTVVATGPNAHLVSGWKDVIQLSATTGGTETVVGLKADGTVLAAGSTQVTTAAAQWTDIVQICAGRLHVAALKADGTVVTAGSFVTTDKGEFDVSDWRDIVYVSAGNSTTIGIKADGTMVCTGYNEFGSHGAWRDLLVVAQESVGIVGLRADGRIYLSGSTHGSKGALVEDWDLIP